MSYNGWKNYETWNISMLVFNDESRYELWKRHQRYYKKFTAKTARETSRAIFGEKTPDDVRINNRSIDWEEIANAWNEE